MPGLLGPIRHDATIYSAELLELSGLEIRFATKDKLNGAF